MLDFEGILSAFWWRMKHWAKYVLAWFAVMGAIYGICYLINPDVLWLAPITWGTLIAALLCAGFWAAGVYWGSPHNK